MTKHFDQSMYSFRMVGIAAGASAEATIRIKNRSAPAAQKCAPTTFPLSCRAVRHLQHSLYSGAGLHVVFCVRQPAASRPLSKSKRVVRRPSARGLSALCIRGTVRPRATLSGLNRSFLGHRIGNECGAFCAHSRGEKFGGSVKKANIVLLPFLGVFVIATGLTLTLESALAQPTPQAPARSVAAHAFDPHDISGFWELAADSRMVPAAELLPSMTKADIDHHLEADRRVIRYCDERGTPQIMDPGMPIDIVQGHREIIIFASEPAAPRHIYLDRADHINPEIFDPTSNGDSIGRWEGDTLVVDTIGFSATRGITAIPGGGFRTPHSHLVERYRLLENGSILSVKFTWTDPTVYQSPHSYEFHYDRVEQEYSPARLPCNPYDDTRAEFLGFKPGLPVKTSNTPGAPAN